VASEQDRPDVKRHRARWRNDQGLIDPKRLVFIDETWTKTNMTRRYGWAPNGERLVDKVPHGHWKTARRARICRVRRSRTTKGRCRSTSSRPTRSGRSATRGRPPVTGEPRIFVSRSIFILVDDRDRKYSGRGNRAEDSIGYIDEPTRTIFGRSYAGEPDALIEALRKDEAIAEADALPSTVPNQLGVGDNAHVAEPILKLVAPPLAWS
jgi:alkanesulfonate monooxygenase SsuD/methylene tetrahydromethanopterin reductase-like flavin-dependent oxidoreductase (luciferase family)